MTNNPAELNAAGLQALGRGDAASAVALFSRAAAADPASPLLWYNLSTAHSVAGDQAGESAALDKALDRDPYFDHALLCKGRLLEAQGKSAEALDYYRRLLAATDPNARQGPGFMAGLTHARTAVAAANDALASRLDSALLPALAALTDDDSRRFRHFIDTSLGRRRIYQHQPLVLNYPYLPAEQFFDQKPFPLAGSAGGSHSRHPRRTAGAACRG